MANENLMILFVFNVKKGKGKNFVDTWNHGINWLKTQPGFINETLAQSHDDAGIYMSAQEWKSANDFRNAASNQNFQETMNQIPVREDVTVASYSVISKDAEEMAA